MKFAKQLSLRAAPEYQHAYLDFRGLKKLLTTMLLERDLHPEDPSSFQDQAQVFTQAVSAELTRVEAHWTEEYDRLLNDIGDLENRAPDQHPETDQAQWVHDLKSLIKRITLLLEYTKMNVMGFGKIAKKFDKAMPDAHITDTITSLVSSARFSQGLGEDILIRTRRMWGRRASVSSPPHGEVDVIMPPAGASADTITYDQLRLDALPPGHLSRFWVAVSEDGLGLPIRVPMIVAKGRRGGPVVGITAALHGDELNGIPLIHRLMRDIPCDALYGTVCAVVIANTPGFLRMQRGYSDGSDLNRLMPGKKDGTAAQVYAYGLMERIVGKFEYVLDLHTASRGRSNSLYARADMTHGQTSRMAYLQHPEIIVHNTSPDGSLRGAAMARGIPAITVEIGDGSRIQGGYVRNALLGVSNILSQLHMLPDIIPDPPMISPVICARSYWIFSSGGGILAVHPGVCEWVKRGEEIATLTSVFGDVVQRFVAPEDGIIVGKSRDPVCQAGSRIVHLGCVDASFAGVSQDGHL